MEVLRFDHRTKNGQAYWLCKCKSCGKEKSARLGDIYNHMIPFITAAELYATGALLPGNAGLYNYLYRRYKRSADERNLEWQLSLQDVKNLTSANCVYCGSAPSEEALKRKFEDNRFMEFNGIDRIDNSQGYTTNNIVTSCYICNRAKSSLSQSAFYCWIKKLIEHQK